MSVTYVGLDLETTGLDPKENDILEVGVVLFDKDLQPIAHENWLVETPRAKRDRETGGMDGFVLDMHTMNDLFGDIIDEKKHVFREYEAVERSVLTWLDDHNVPAKPYMVGNSVTFDRVFLAEYMPQLLNRFHYRSVDATSVMQAAEIGGVNVADIKATDTTHRAVDDILAAGRDIRACITALKTGF